MKIREILRSKGNDVVTIGPDQTVLEAIRLLVERGIGSAVVVRGQELLGIITERDVLRLSAEDPSGVPALHVGEAMTSELVTGRLDDELLSVMDTMTTNRIRHLPILDEGRLVGLVSIGDVVNACRVRAESENEQMKQYIQGSTW